MFDKQTKNVFHCYMSKKFFHFTKVGSDQIKLVGVSGQEMTYLQNKGFSVFARNKMVFNPGGPYAIDTLLLSNLTELGFSFSITP